MTADARPAVGLVCIDVDGTLVGSSGTVRDDVWAAAARVRASGRRLAICSGRPAFGKARDYAARLDGEGWHVFQNGASVVHLPTSESHSRALPHEAIARLVARGRATGRILELYSDDTYAVERDDERARRHAALLGIPFRVCDLLAFDGPIVRAQWVVPHVEGDEVLEERHDGLVVASSLSPVMPDTIFINVTPAGVHKGAAIARVAAAYGLPMDEVMMVGDGANDATALRAVGYPVAMANAEAEALAEARWTVGHVDRGGLVEALEMAMRL